jgi:hypothetical protein
MGMARNFNYKGSFHYVSKDAFYWIKNQAYVKEESITDRILYELNRNNPHVICHEFKRNEEALNGADWEWWLLFDNPFKTHDFYKDTQSLSNTAAYRFRIQAKKLLADNKDKNYVFRYANKNDFQIKLLIERAKEERAIPLYAFYSNAFRKSKEVSINLDGKEFLIDNVCSDCINGIYLLSATWAYDNHFKAIDHKSTSQDIVNESFPASILDFIVASVHPDYQIQKALSETSYMYKHGEFPKYLSTLISQLDYRNESEESISFYQDQIEYVEPEDVCGVGLIDCRREIKREKYRNY